MFGNLGTAICIQAAALHSLSFQRFEGWCRKTAEIALVKLSFSVLYHLFFGSGLDAHCTSDPFHISHTAHRVAAHHVLNPAVG